MADRAGSNAIEEIKARLDLVEMVRSHVDLRPAGNRFMGVCPFHHETKPSFSVNPELGLFYCFGCQASGDVIDFYCQINGMDFKEAIVLLARETNVSLGPAYEGGRGEKAKARSVCLELNNLAQSFFYKQLTQHEEPKRYLKGRGIDGTLAKKFGLGWSPDAWQELTNFIQARGFKPEQGVTAGLLSKSEKGRIYDRFRGRVTFPIHSVSGQIVAFGGRIIQDGDPKYLNSSESPVYTKGEHLYGLHQARQEISQKKQALLTEGYLDVIALHRFGFANSCGVLGTALTKSQIKRLAGFCSRVDLVFDGDRAGLQAAQRSAEMILAYGLDCRVVRLPDGEDVDSLLSAQGKEALEDHLEKAVQGLDFCVQMVRSLSPREMVAWAQRFIQTVDDAPLRGFFLPKVAKGLGLAEQDLRASLRGKVSGGTKRNIPAREWEEKKGPSRRDKELLGFAIRYPEHIKSLHEKGLQKCLSERTSKELWEKIIEFGPGDAYLHFNEQEKNFYVRCQMNGEPEEDHEARYKELLNFIEKAFASTSKKVLRQKIEAAQSAGDVDTAMRLLREYNTLLSR